MHRCGCRHARAFLPALLLALLPILFAPRPAVSGDPRVEVSGVEIHDVLVLQRETCTLTIRGGDVSMCDGDSCSVSADLLCGPGDQRVRDPQWFLDGSPVGTGDEIRIAPEAGEHLLLATCGSCEDQITVRVGICPPALPSLDAAFACDSTESTAGIFLEPNLAPVGPVNFPSLRLLMRPFTLSAPPGFTGEGMYLEATVPLQVFRASGAPVGLPAWIPVEQLPYTFLVNATGRGEGMVLASSVPPDQPRTPENTDRVRVRVGALPGLAGRVLSAFPHFEFVQTFNDNDSLRGALDPFRHAERLGLSYRAYVVRHRTPVEWGDSSSLVDESGGFEMGSVTPGSVAANVLNLWTSNLDGGGEVGKPYDVVYDFGLDGRLDPGDLIDGFSDRLAGFHVVRDLSLPGPHATRSMLYSGGSYLGQITYYPADLAFLGKVPLIVISHGYGHQFTWYQYLQEHLASYGYIVMAHESNVNPGIESASSSTLANTDYILGNQQTIGGGVLSGHIDEHRIVWIGHSRGGEGVTRAYDRIYDQTYIPIYFRLEDIVAVSAIAPCVHLTATEHDPHQANYHLIAGGADGDVTGGADCPACQFFRISEVAQGNVQTTYIHGASHNDFNCCGVHDGQGPDLIGPEETQLIAKSYYLALVKCYAEGNAAAREYFTRSYESLHPSGIAPSVTVANTYRDGVGAGSLVVDDYQTRPEFHVSSSGGSVAYDVTNLVEGHLNDGDTYFAWTPSDPMNGMTRDEGGGDYSLGAVFDWTAGDDRFLEFEILPGHRDLSFCAYLSLRACQGTRHPETVALGGPLGFSVGLRDGAGRSVSVKTEGYGLLSQPYPRTGLGSGAGWQNELATLRIPLTAFVTDGTGIDLTDVVAVRLEFGAGHGSARGRLGLDDIQVTLK